MCLRRFLGVIAVALFYACNGPAEKAGVEMEQTHMAPRLVKDTIHVVVQETLRTLLVQDTIQTVIADTQRTVVFDTVRTLLFPAYKEKKEGLPAPSDDEYMGTAAEVADQVLEGEPGSFLKILPPQYTTVSVRDLDSVQVALLGQLTGLSTTNRITKVRWGRKMAPENHPDAGKFFVSVWTDPDSLTIVHFDR